MIQADYIESKHYEALRRRVDEILYYVWDPLGVSDNGYSRGEYTSYVDDVAELIVTTDIATVERKLCTIAGQVIGTYYDPDHCHTVAVLLFEHFQAVKEGVK